MTLKLLLFSLAPYYILKYRAFNFMANGEKRSCAISDESISDAKSLTTNLVSSIKRDGIKRYDELKTKEDLRKWNGKERFLCNLRNTRTLSLCCAEWR